MKGSQYIGLKSSRKVKSKKPEYDCDNCKCKRYAPCYCMRKGGVVPVDKIMVVSDKQ